MDVLCDSGVAGGCLVKMGHCRLVGGTFSIWFSLRAVLMGGVSPIGQPKGSQVPLDPSVQIPN